MKRFISIIIFVLTVSSLFSAVCADDNFSTEDLAALDYLASELEESSDYLLRMGEDLDDIYSELM